MIRKTLAHPIFLVMFGVVFGIVGAHCYEAIKGCPHTAIIVESMPGSGRFIVVVENRGDAPDDLILEVFLSGDGYVFPNYTIRGPNTEVIFAGTTNVIFRIEELHSQGQFVSIHFTNCGDWPLKVKAWSDHTQGLLPCEFMEASWIPLEELMGEETLTDALERLREKGY